MRSVRHATYIRSGLARHWPVGHAMAVFKDVGQELRFVQQQNHGALYPARAVRACNVLCWVAGTTALAVTADSGLPMKVTCIMCCVGCFIECYALQLLCTLRVWDRYGCTNKPGQPAVRHLCAVLFVVPRQIRQLPAWFIRRQIWHAPEAKQTRLSSENSRDGFRWSAAVSFPAV